MTLILRTSLLVFAAAATMSSCLIEKTLAQGPPANSKPATGQGAHASPVPSTVYEDSEIKVRIPAGWALLPRPGRRDLGRGRYGSLGNSVLPEEGRVVLEKKGYVLAIAYDTSHASGIIGGRFPEVFNIPWPGIDDEVNCSMHLGGFTQPASRALMFINVVIDSGLAEVREACGIAKDLAYKVDTDTGEEFVGERRWFGGYFTSEGGRWFFPSKGEGCGEKAYTLTFTTDTPGKLPVVGDQKLKSMIREAIDVVNSIRYKRCPPASGD